MSPAYLRPRTNTVTIRVLEFTHYSQDLSLPCPPLMSLSTDLLQYYFAIAMEIVFLPHTCCFSLKLSQSYIFCDKKC